MAACGAETSIPQLAQKRAPAGIAAPQRLQEGAELEDTIDRRTEEPLICPETHGYAKS
jgi:hypothetical protein